MEKIEALQKEHHFISAVLDTLGALLVVLDREGRVVQFNHACEEISGYSFEEVKGRYIWELFLVSEEVMPLKAVFNDIKDRRFPNRHENWWITKEGKRCLIAWSSTALCDAAGQVEYGIWVGIDITRRIRMEEELRAGEERYRALIENVKEGVALIADKKLLFVNEAFVRIFGYNSSEELIGKQVRCLVDTKFEEKFGEFLKTALDKKSWGLAFRGLCLAKDGREFWAENLSSVIRHRGKPAILITVRDVTENMLWEQTVMQEAEYFRSENVKLRSTIGERYRLGNIIGKSPVMQQVYELILKAASTDANVIILGRSGTGKELVARAVHDLSARSDKAFVPVNCGAVPENLIESEFFGHRKGAFTGAHSDKNGYLHAADKGTLFLDEIGDIGLSMQVKLLRAIEGGGYMAVGDSKVRFSDVRIIAAMNKDPLEMMKKGLMREDFFYRISVIPIRLPDLKDRKADIPLLAEYFLEKYSPEGRVRKLPPDFMEKLTNYDWPGNVRELQNVLQRFLTVRSLDVLEFQRGFEVRGEGFEASPLQDALENFEKKMIVSALERVRWNRTKAAAMLGISRRSLFRRIEKLGI
jgi:PAS domain S-box-containing protein